MRKSISVGINYVGTTYQLSGCINDADAWASFLAKNGFDASVLAEKQARCGDILLALTRLIEVLQPGDIGAFTYSGHGTWVPDVSGDEPDGRDEAIVPYDVGDDGHNLIIDDQFAELFSKLRQGARLLFITDSCHSGTVHRSLFRQSAGVARYLPPCHFLVSQKPLNRAFAAEHSPPKSDAALPGVIHFAGCKDGEFAIDAEINGQACGAFTHYALEAFRTGLNGKKPQTYGNVFKHLRTMLPSVDYQQTPQFQATTDLAAARLF